ncbi:peptidoglycan-binding protein [Kitasatospora sp. NPDC057015]|uniref:peptidoglycan-binding domain-containing protein n=1 Tax=Kitasatospora sp. NPDC057015 TaxID=3346001 RepID=UPI0036380178
MRMTNRRIATGAAGAALVLGSLLGAAPTASADSRACTWVSSDYRPELSYGAQGDAVKQIQCLVDWNSRWGGALAQDGIWGQNTDSAVRWVQWCNGLVQDGIVGRNTWNKLYNPNSGCGF